MLASAASNSSSFAINSEMLTLNDGFCSFWHLSNYIENLKQLISTDTQVKPTGTEHGTHALFGLSSYFLLLLLVSMQFKSTHMHCRRSTRVI